MCLDTRRRSCVVNEIAAFPCSEKFRLGLIDRTHKKFKYIYITAKSRGQGIIVSVELPSPGRYPRSDLATTEVSEYTPAGFGGRMEKMRIIAAPESLNARYAPHF